MSRLQGHSQGTSSTKYNITIPQALVDSLGWTKGDDLDWTLITEGGKIGLKLTKD